MRNFVVKAFDEYLVGTSNVFTPTSMAELLGSADRICGLAVAHTSIGIGPTVTIQFEHSFDGTRWINQNVTPEVNAWAPTGGIFNVMPFASTRIPTLNYVRLRIALGSVSTSVPLEIWLCGRSPNR
jgi:hypothetical protein